MVRPKSIFTFVWEAVREKERVVISQETLDGLLEFFEFGGFSVGVILFLNTAGPNKCEWVFCGNRWGVLITMIERKKQIAIEPQ